MARHRVQVLRAAGKTLKQIVAETGVSQRSVQRIERERTCSSTAAISASVGGGSSWKLAGPIAPGRVKTPSSTSECKCTFAFKAPPKR